MFSIKIDAEGAFGLELTVSKDSKIFRKGRFWQENTF
jgi:hypothetical protein